jgi:hypothetical protein
MITIEDIKSQKETYLGDGLYASFDGFQFRLRAPRDDGFTGRDHVVYLETQVITAFTEFVEAVGVCMREYQKQQSGAEQ